MGRAWPPPLPSTNTRFYTLCSVQRVICSEPLLHFISSTFSLKQKMTEADNEANKKYMEKVMTTGTWIDKKFLEDVISNSIGNEVKVLDYDVKPAVGAGDNYLSILYRTGVRFIRNGTEEKEEKYLMVKGEPTAQFFIQFIEEMGIFIKEMTMYNNCLPLLHKRHKEHFPEETPFVAPVSYRCSRKNTIVMEDLGKQGYQMANRRNQLDFQHCAATLQTLARFHALSVKVQEEDPELIKSVTKEFYGEHNREKMAPFLVDALNIVAEVHEGIEENARFGPILRDISKFVWQKMMKMVEPSKKFNVLNHGDLWVNNILFKYKEDGSVLDAKVVDFQLSRYCSPALDLHYFLFTSVQPEILKERMFELILIYHSTLINSLEALGVDFKYTIEDLHNDMRENAAYSILTMVQILPVTIAAPGDNLNLDDINIDDIKTGEDNPMNNKYRHPIYVGLCSKYFSHLESIGYLSDAVLRLQPLVDELEENESKLSSDKSKI